MSAIDLITARPWAITEDALRQLMAIALREQADPALAAELRAARAERPAAVAMRKGRPLDGTRGVVLREGVAVIAIEGPIFRYANLFTEMSGATSIESLAMDVQAALASPFVDAILFSIDSPGGEVTGINELAAAITAARGQKPIGAYIDGLGASAAYWLASAAETITIDATAAIGSIGVVLPVADPTKTVSRTIEIVSSRAPKKRPDVLTEAGRDEYQQMVDAIEQVFVEAVAAGRGTTPEAVLNDFGQGGLKVGRDAVAAGMADQLGSFEGALVALRTEASNRKRPPAMGGKAGADMDWSAFFGGLFKAAAEQEPAMLALATPQPVEPAAAPTPDPGPGASAATDAMQAQLADLAGQLAAQQEAARTQAATSWASAMIAAGKALPAEATALVELHARAAADDAADQGNRVALVEGLVGSRPAHTLTKELVQTPASLAADNGGPSRERVQELLAMSPLGQTALARQIKK